MSVMGRIKSDFNSLSLWRQWGQCSTTDIWSVLYNAPFGAPSAINSWDITEASPQMKPIV